MMLSSKDPAARLIKTVRSKKKINSAAKTGFRPLVKPVQPSADIWEKVCVLQHQETGKIKTCNDYRGGIIGEGYKAVTEFIQYYPHKVGNPYAAYLVPPDLKPGDLVYLEDLIEDIKIEYWNQGDSIRLESCHAVWNGEDFELDEEHPRNPFPLIFQG